MFNFFKKKEPNKLQQIDIISKTASLLIHAAKIDENYSAEEDKIIKQTLIKIGAKNENVDEKLYQQFRSTELLNDLEKDVADYRKRRGY